MSLAVLLLSNILLPPPPPPKAHDGEQAEAAAKPDAEPGGDEKPAGALDQPAADVVAPAEDRDDNAPPAPAAAEVPLEFVSLGSLDRDTGCRMLVTFTNQGAAVRRAELTSPRFRDLVDRSGYLGHLELENTSKGLKVRVVGAGTPAALADIRAGDVITSVQRAKGEPDIVKSADDFEAVRTRTRPGQDFILTVVRDAGAPQQLTVKLARRPRCMSTKGAPNRRAPSPNAPQAPR